MNILFKNIPIGTTGQGLIQFINSNFDIKPANQNNLLLSVNGVSMMEIQDNYTRPIEQFSLVRISPTSIGQEIIRQLNGLLFKTNTIIVRPFYIRSASNDPRMNTTPPSIIVNNRIKDRRDSPLIFSRRI